MESTSRKTKRLHSGKSGRGYPFPTYGESEGEYMFTISDIIADINRGCMINNMAENCFSYRIIYFVNEENKGSRHYIDTGYESLREALENIIRGHLSLTNSVVVVQTTVLKDSKCVCLQSRSFAFSLEEYFERISGECKSDSRRGNIMHNRYAVK